MNPLPRTRSRAALPVAAALLLGLLVATPALAQDAVRAWGDNSFGQTNVPSDLGPAVAIAASGDHTLAVLADGTVRAWGRSDRGQTAVPSDLGPAVAVAAGYNHSLALLADGTVRAWGDNSFGQADVPSDLGPAVAVAAGTLHSLAVLADGTVRAWGRNHLGQTDVPSDLGPAVAVAAGEGHSLALLADGTVRAWGDDFYGDVPSDLGPAVAVAAGYAHSLTLLADGTVRAWGLNIDGQTDVPSDLGPAVAVAAGHYHSLALLADGTIHAWGFNDSGQADVPSDLGPAVAVAAGVRHSLALLGGVANTPPVADAGEDQTVVVGQSVALDGSGSYDPDGDALTYAWTLNGPGSPALSDAASATPSFCAATAGAYTAALVVSDGTEDSEPDEVTVTAVTATAALDGLLADVAALYAAGVLNAGQARGLARNLTQAKTLLARGKTAEALAALAGFRQQALDLWQLDGVLSEEQAAALVDAADAITGAVGSPCTTAPAAPAASASEGPSSPALLLAYPNPSRGVVALRFELPEAGAVRLAVYDALGREVAVLLDGRAEAGRHEAVLDGAGLPAGTYLVRLTADGRFAQTQRVTVLR